MLRAALFIVILARLASAQQIAHRALQPTAQLDAAPDRARCARKEVVGHTSDALDTFILLLDRHPDDAEGTYMLERIYYREGRIDYAIGQFQRVLKLNAKSYEAYDNLGLCYQADDKTELASTRTIRSRSICRPANTASSGKRIRPGWRWRSSVRSRLWRRASGNEPHSGGVIPGSCSSARLRIARYSRRTAAARSFCPAP